MLNGFFGLRLDAVVSRHHEHHNIGDLGAAGPHAGEGGVARRVEKTDHALFGFDMVGADVLGNAPRFARRHFGLANVVEQAGLAVVHVAHDGHHRWARHALGVADLGENRLFK